MRYPRVSHAPCCDKKKTVIIANFLVDNNSNNNYKLILGPRSKKATIYVLVIITNSKIKIKILNLTVCAVLDEWIVSSSC